MTGGEKNLQILLNEMQPVLREGHFVFASVDLDTDISNLPTIATFREEEGIALILKKEIAFANNIDFEYESAMITLNVHSSLDAVGFLAAITHKLADAGISVNPVSAFYHDHLFVPYEKAQLCMDVLAEFKSS